MLASPSQFKFVAQFILVTLCIFITGRLGLLIPYLISNISLFWLPTGIAVAALTLFNLRMLPAVFLGSFLINFTNTSHISLSLSIAIGNTLAVFLTYLIFKRTHFQTKLDRPRNIIILIFAAAIGMQFSAIIGTLSLFIHGIILQTALIDAWEIWWMGDFLGVLLGSPFLFALSNKNCHSLRSHWLEVILITIFSLLVTTKIFNISQNIFFVSLMFLILTWSSFRFGQLGASGITLLVSGVVVFQYSRGDSSFSNNGHGLIFLWSFICAISTFSLFLAALKAESEQISNTLLLNLNRLKEAQKIAKIGSWEFNLITYELQWSSEHYAIFEIPEPQPSDKLYGMYRARIHPDDLAALDHRLADARINGGRFYFEHHILFEDGRIKTILGIGQVNKDHLGQFVSINGTAQDITERKTLENALKQQQEKITEQRDLLKLITDNIPGPVSRIDRNGRYMFVNKMYKEYFGLTPEQIIGKTHKEVLQPNLFKEVEVYIQRALKGERVSFETPFITHDNRRLSIFTTFIPYFDEKNNAPDGFFTIVYNITAIKEAEIKVIHSSRLASLGELSAGIAHEINNPLTIITNSLNLLAKYTNDPEKFAQKIEFIQKSCLRISKIVAGLKKFTHTAEQSVFVSHSPEKILKEALILTEIKTKNNDIFVSVDYKTQSQISCSEIEIEQVIINIINNAIDAIIPEPEKWIKISLFDDSDFVVLRIMNSGPKISEEVQNKLFQPFFTTKKIGEGTGLGLSISKGILDEHKATISVVNELPHTCFEIKFPISK